MVRNEAASNDCCDPGKTLELLDDMNQLYAYCDCMGWGESE